jgi:hypothetical protein
MEKYVIAAAWYLLGIGLYFVYNLFVRKNMKEYIAMVRKECPALPISDALIVGVTIIVGLLCSFVWPISMVDDVISILKGEDNA